MNDSKCSLTHLREQVKPTATDLDRFWKYVSKSNGCWLWIGNTDKNGYGLLWFRDGAIRAHRLSWIIHFGNIPQNMHVLHNCIGGDNPSCVRPSHLWLGTSDANMADMAIKGTLKGENSGHNKLMDSQIQAIRDRREAGEIYRTIAEDYGVTIQAIFWITSRKNWRHIK